MFLLRKSPECFGRDLNDVSNWPRIQSLQSNARYLKHISLNSPKIKLSAFYIAFIATDVLYDNYCFRILEETSEIL